MIGWRLGIEAAVAAAILAGILWLWKDREAAREGLIKARGAVEAERALTVKLEDKITDVNKRAVESRAALDHAISARDKALEDAVAKDVERARADEKERQDDPTLDSCLAYSPSDEWLRNRVR